MADAVGWLVEGNGQRARRHHAGVGGTDLADHQRPPASHAEGPPFYPKRVLQPQRQAGRDKDPTARIWESKSGRLLRVLRCRDGD